MPTEYATRLAVNVGCGCTAATIAALLGSIAGCDLMSSRHGLSGAKGVIGAAESIRVQPDPPPKATAPARAAASILVPRSRPPTGQGEALTTLPFIAFRHI